MSQIKELWKDIEGYEGLYQVSSLGRVKALERCIDNNGVSQQRKSKIITQVCTKGYMQTRLNKKGVRYYFYTHRLVAESFLKREDNKEVNHIDGNKLNNNVWNLEWCTRGENISHAFKFGLQNNKGENHPSSKLTNEDILIIFDLYESGVDKQDILTKYKIHRVHLNRILRGASWNHLTRIR